MGILEVLLVVAVGGGMYYLGTQNGKIKENKKSEVAVESNTDVSVGAPTTPSKSKNSATKTAPQMTATVKEQPKHNDNYWLTVLLYFASFLIGLGIVAEIAYNWHNITNAVKLVGAIVALVLNAAFLIWCEQKQKNVLKQVVACVFAFLIMGVIGLIGQVFQLQSNIANGCLLWSLISWPLLLFVPNLLWLWLPLFFGGMRLHSIIFRDIAREMIGDFGSPDVPFDQFLTISNVYFQVLSSLCLYGYFIVYELWMNSVHKNDNRVTLPLKFYCGVLMLHVYCSIVHMLHYHPAVAANFMIYARAFTPYLMLGILVWAMNYRNKRFSFMPLFLFGIIFEGLLVMQLSPKFFGWSFESSLPGVFVMLLLGYASYHKMPRLRTLSTILCIIWFIRTFEDDIFDVVPWLMMCAVFAFLSYRARSRRGFNTAVILAVMRILGYYADVEDLQYMGLYLIGSGLLIVVTILGLMKYAPLLWRNEDEK